MVDDDQKLITFDFCFTNVFEVIERQSFFKNDLYLLVSSRVDVGLFCFNFCQ